VRAVRHRVVVDETPWVLGEPREDQLADRVLAGLLRPSPGLVRATRLLAPGAALFVLLCFYTVFTGIGTWGNDIPNAWAFGILNFVFWIGIGHAGTFISAMLLLLEQPWRNAVNRLAETMTLFAVAIAAIFPLLHLGRAWFFYWFVPYPSVMRVWPQFRSALGWDIAAILTYFTVSLLFWYMGLVPDLATVRDRATGRWRRRLYGVFALGWRGSARHWSVHRLAYGILGGVAAPLVVSVHTIVSFDFSIAQLPGWHSTIFPPLFVIGAIHSGFALVLLLFVPVRRWLRLHDVMTDRHLASLATVMLVCACLLGGAYATEVFVAWVSGETFERQTYLHHRPFGPYGWAFWATILTNAVVPQILWHPRARRSELVCLGVGAAVLFGMWTERFMIVVGPLTQGFLPSSWEPYAPSPIDVALLLSSFCLFGLLYVVFLRTLPAVALCEIKELGVRAGSADRQPALLGPARSDARGLVAEFPDPGALIEGIHAARSLGLRRLDAHMPWNEADVIEALRLPRAPVARWALMGGLAGATLAYVVQWWTTAVDFPLDVGGRPLHSALSFVPITFELGVLGAALGAFTCWLWTCALPRPWHPLFELEGFRRATVDRYMLSVDGRDPRFDAVSLSRALRDAGALGVAPTDEPLLGDDEREAV